MKIEQQWTIQAQKVLSCLLVDEQAYWAIEDVLRGDRRYFPVKERPIWDGIQKCVEDDTLPTPSAVTLRVNGKATPGYIQKIAGLFTPTDNRQLIYNVEQLREFSRIATLRELGKQFIEMESITNIEDVVGKASVELSSLLAKGNQRDPSAKAVGEAAWADAEKFKGSGTPTGLGWFDTISGGLWGGMNYWVAAAYKSGKSTLMRNCILHAALEGYHSIAMCAEGTRELFALDCQAMIATKILYKQGFKPLRLSGLFLRRSYINNLAIFHQQEIEAIEQAKVIWSTLPISLYDTKDGMRDLQTLRYLIKRDKLEKGSKACWIDYSQLFGKGTLFEKQSGSALMFQELAVENDIAMCVLAQKSEEGVKDKSGYSPKVKGGGDAAAAADFLMIPSLDPETSTMNIELKLSRHTSRTDKDHLINPASGLILGEL